MKANIVRISGGAVVACWLAIILGFGSSTAQSKRRKETQDRNGKWSYAALDSVPERARVKANPFEGDPEARIAGGKLFEEHCSECHGMKAEGGTRGPSLLKKEVQEATPGALFWILSNGVVRRGMPDWSKLPAPERWQIVTFLQSFRAVASSRSSASPRSGD